MHSYASKGSRIKKVELFSRSLLISRDLVFVFALGVHSRVTSLGRSMNAAIFELESAPLVPMDTMCTTLLARISQLLGTGMFRGLRATHS